MTTHTTERTTPLPIATDRVIALVFAIIATVGALPGLLGLTMSGAVALRGLDMLVGDWKPSLENVVIWGAGALCTGLFITGFWLLPRYYLRWRRWTPTNSSHTLWPATIISNALGALICAILTSGEPPVSVLTLLWGGVLVTLATIAMRAERRRLSALS